MSRPLPQTVYDVWMRPKAVVSLVIVLLFSTIAAAQSNGVVSSVAGVFGETGLRDGAAHQAAFNRPTWLDIDFDTGAIYVVDRANHQLRKILNGRVSTLRVETFIQPPSPVDFDFGGPYGGGIAVEPPLSGCGSGPYADGIFVASSARHQLVFVTNEEDHTTLASRDDSSPIIGAGIPGSADGAQSIAAFNNPGDVALSWVYRPGGYHEFGNPSAIYIADTANHTVRRIRFRLSFEFCPQPYSIDTMAGVAGDAGTTDGPARTARFHAPRGIAAAPDGSVYVADTGNHTIRRIAPDGTVTTVAGEAGVAGRNDGVATEAHLNSPSGLDVNELGEVFIADTGNYVVRKLTTDGRLITIAGVSGTAGYANGPARTALFSGPIGLRLAGTSLYIADTANNVIRKLDLTAPEPRRRAIRH